MDSGPEYIGAALCAPWPDDGSGLASAATDTDVAGKRSLTMTRASRGSRNVEADGHPISEVWGKWTNGATGALRDNAEASDRAGRVVRHGCRQRGGRAGRRS